MNQFGTILKFELKNYFKNKVFVGVTLFIVAVIAVVIFFPKIAASFESDSTDTSGESLPVMLIAADSEDEAQQIKEAFASAFEDYNIQVTAKGVEDIKAKITDEEAECGFYFESPVSYTYYVNDLSLYDENTTIADQVLQNVYRLNTMMQNGISAEKAGEILSAQINHNVENLGKDQMQNFFYTYIMIFALYMVILLYGQLVATSVATEKSSRAMELLITSAKPTSMMSGKVMAACIAGLTQLTCIFGSAFLLFNINKGDWQDNQIVNSIFNMPLNLLIYMLLFFVLGFFIYAFLFGAVGSTVSKVEDINTAVMPITMLFIVAFMVVIFSMSSGNVDNILMIVCSYIPFTSPMAMFTRIAMSTVPIYEIIISTVILVASLFGVGILSAKIYRVGVLLYGTKPKIGSIIKSIWKA